jgi:hypothetical protein
LQQLRAFVFGRVQLEPVRIAQFGTWFGTRFGGVALLGSVDAQLAHESRVFADLGQEASRRVKAGATLGAVPSGRAYTLPS